MSLGLLCIYTFVVLATLAVRLAVHEFGVTMSQHGLAALRWAMILHGAAGVVALSLLLLARWTNFSRPWAPKLLLATIPFVLLVSADRLIAIAYSPIPEPTGLHMPHPRRGWTARPGWSGMDGTAALRINSRGFRGPEIPATKAPNERRILFLGDSVTFGSRVPEQSIFVSRIQDMASVCGAPPVVRTINASVAAYSPWQEYDLLINEGLRCDPDFIVQVFCLNDVLEKFQLEQFGGYSRGFEPPRPQPLEWSGLYRAARAWRASLIRPSNDELWRLRGEYSTRRLLSDPDAPAVHKAWQITLGNMSKIIAAARDHSVPIVIVCIPHLDQLSARPPEGPPPQSVLADFAAQHNVPFLDLLASFREHVAEHNLKPSALYLDPLHFSPAGHDLAAQLIFEFLSNQGWCAE